MFYFIKKHCFAIILAVVLGVLMILPFIYFQIKLGSDFRGIFPQIVDDEMFYYARIKDVADGHSFLSNAYLFEHKGGLPQQLFLAEYILAQPIKLFDLNINTAHLIYNFLLPAIAFFLTYLALYLISKSRFWSIIFSFFLFFGLYLMIFIRPVSPQFNFIFWLSEFIFLWLFLEKRSKKFLFLSALNFGLLFYIYPYYWTFYLIFFGILTAVYFWKNRGLALKIAVIIASGLVLAIPYFYFNYLASRLPYYTETLTRIGMIYSHFPSGARIILWSALGLLTFGWFLWRKVIKWDIKTIFFVSGILASIIAVNQHLITGKNFEFSSHYDMAAMFFLIFSFAYLWSNLKVGRKLLSVLLVFIVLIVTTGSLFEFSKKAFIINEQAVYRQNYASVLEWLNKNTEKDSVVYANNALSGLMPVYTANNVFYHRNANLFFIFDKEVLDRFILNNFFEDFNKNFIIENDRSIFGVRFVDAYGHAVQGNKLWRLLGIEPEPEIYLPNFEIEKVMARAKTLQAGDFKKKLSRYRVDYLILDKERDINWQISNKDFQQIFKSNDAIIYKIK
ncbi:MAG: hypothetical protein Q8N88_04130 [Nanoarchaeota archaeon]|nr:hypothetical protein [Nanoarchaeota archaeon]